MSSGSDPCICFIRNDSGARLRDGATPDFPRSIVSSAELVERCVLNKQATTTESRSQQGTAKVSQESVNTGGP